MFNYRLAIYFLFASSIIRSVPSTIVMIRHGEREIKTDSNGQPVYKTGLSLISTFKNWITSRLLNEEDANLEYTIYLSVKGWERAHALIPFFTLNKEYSSLGKPVAIFAKKPSSQHSSVRPIDTITPLAKSLDLPVLSQYDDEEIKELTTYIMQNPEFDGKYVLICWDHNRIPAIAELFGITQAPKIFPNVFDRVWIAHFDADGKVLSFENRPQRLLFGDSEK